MQTSNGIFTFHLIKNFDLEKKNPIDPLTHTHTLTSYFGKVKLSDGTSSIHGILRIVRRPLAANKYIFTLSLLFVDVMIEQLLNNACLKEELDSN